MELVNHILDYELLSISNYTLKVSQVIGVLTIIAVTKIILWVIKKALFRNLNSVNKIQEVPMPYFKLLNM